MSANQGNVTPNNENLGGAGENGQSSKDEDKPPVWLIVTVIVLGLAIIGMLVVIVMKVLIGDKDDVAVPEEIPVASEEVDQQSQGLLGILKSNIDYSYPEYLEHIEVNRPKGSQLVSSNVEGFYVILRFKLEDGSDQIMIVNRSDGSVDTIIIPVND